MPYVGSHIWKLRHKVGHDLLVLPATDVIAVDEQDRVLLVHNIDLDRWVFPGGYVEEGRTTRQNAAQELLEEGGINTSVEDLVPIASVSGFTLQYGNGDTTQPHTQVFITRQWTDAGNELDSVEITKRKWFTTNELLAIDLHVNVKNLLDAYLAYRDTGEYQVLEHQVDS